MADITGSFLAPIEVGARSRQVTCSHRGQGMHMRAPPTGKARSFHLSRPKMAREKGLG
jgi:hypothetical protein